jgi:hypothetical protein
MAGIPDRDYNAACGRLASRLGVSLAAARRRVDIRAAQAEIRDTAGKRALAVEMLEEASSSGLDHGALLSAQLGTVGNDDYFMLED